MTGNAYLNNGPGNFPHALYLLTHEIKINTYRCGYINIDINHPDIKTCILTYNLCPNHSIDRQSPDFRNEDTYACNHMPKSRIVAKPLGFSYIGLGQESDQFKDATLHIEFENIKIKIIF